MPADQTAPPARRPSRLRAVVRGTLTGAVLAVAAQACYIFLGPNFRAVVPGSVYRSGRLPPAQLEFYLRAHHVRTVVNLCGCCDPLPPYLDECRTTARLDVAQEDVGLSAGRMPP